MGYSRSSRTGVRIPSRDALNIYIDRGNIVANVVAALVFDTTEIAEPITLPNARTWMAQQLDQAPIFRRRLWRIPLDLGNPFWISMEKTSSDNQVYVTPMTEPGWAPVEQSIVKIMNQRIDLRDSVWELHALTDVTGVEGLPEKCCIVVFKAHHAAIDGVGMAYLLRALFAGDTLTDQRGGDTTESIPRALPELARLPGRLFRFLRAMLISRRMPLPPSPAPKSVPATRFNGPVQLDPSVRLQRISLARARQIKKAVPEATVNDIFMAVLSLALGHYLDEHSEHTDELATTIPLDLRPIRESGSANQTAFLRVNLHADVAEPIARLRAIHWSALNIKDWTKEIAVADRPRPFEVVPAAALRAMMPLARLNAKKKNTVGSTTIFSNVTAGPNNLTFLGAPSFAVFSPMPTANGLGLIHQICSLGDIILLTVTVEKQMMGDVDRYMRNIADAFDELEQAALAHIRTRVDIAPDLRAPGA
ncbi:wax ester/triacylglycerol synthase domain-containing protein [Nocardia sp. 348MFTsu5.1]|uniref:wax ester/triacylglycerol synthase domain-containing protein n=1 Tax=Nocardia sp. 348MFTsu5.1 TaxID=1172185 RepID=UPI00036B6F07|nr:wax ester/triacylglycerol synthase domain-containing protein [Nocardia sp. 348MFTsu5.1]